MYVFISNCVKDNEAADAAAAAAKRELVEALEAAGCGVFDYRERPGTAPTWMEDIRTHILNSGCMVYFAKQWPEPDPGVCLIELGAAKILELPIYIFSVTGYQKGTPMFCEYSSRLADALSVAQGLVFNRIEPLVERLQRLGADAGKKSSPLLTLTHVFIRGCDPLQGNSLDRTGCVFMAIQNAMSDTAEAGLGLRRMKPAIAHPGVVGYWSIPSLRGIIALKNGAQAGRSVVSHYEFSAGEWLNSGDLTVQRDPGELLDQVYTLGPMDQSGRVGLLCHGAAGWSLLGRNLDLPLAGPDGLERSVRRTCMSVSVDGRCGFFADGIFYSIDRGLGQIARAEPPDVVADEYYSPPMAAAPARIAAIAGADGLSAIISGGRVEAVMDGGIAGAVHHCGEILHLGEWEPLSIPALLRCLRGQPAVSPGRWAAFARESKLLQVIPATLEHLKWYQRALQARRPSYQSGCGTWFNGQYENPVVYEIDFDGSLDFFEDSPPVPTAHRLEMAWNGELREKLWQAIGNGPPVVSKNTDSGK